jgi:hypothetical protein
MQAHQSQKVDLDRFADLRKTISFIEREETFIRAFPEPGGPPLDVDLFAGIEAR